MENLAQAAEGFKVENFGVAQLVTAALEDFGLLKPEYYQTAKKVH